MYSYDGPVISLASGFLATGTEMVNPVPSVPGTAEMSQPFHARLYPWFMTKASPASAALVGLFPPPDPLKGPNSFAPRLLTSTKSLRLPSRRLTGNRKQIGRAHV